MQSVDEAGHKPAAALRTFSRQGDTVGDDDQAAQAGSLRTFRVDHLPSDFRYVLALQEGAGFVIAHGYSQATGQPVLVSLHAAAGVGQAMGWLVNAQVLGTPLVIMSGQQSRALLTLEGAA